MKKFIKNVLILTVIISFITGGINYAYMHHSINYGTMGECRNDAAYIVNVPDKIQICNFGNSHGYYGFNYDAYCDDFICFNFSLPSQTMSYNYRILQNFQENIETDAVVFICISYTSFFGMDETESEDFLSKNKRYYHFLDKQYIKEYDARTNLFVNYFPALSTDAMDLFKTTIGINQVKDYWQSTTSGDAALSHGLRRYESHVACNVDYNGKRIINEDEISALYEMIYLCKTIGATPILITTPYLSEYTDPVLESDPGFYDDFYEIIGTIINETDVEYFDYQFDDRFSSNYSYFFNSDHLNKEGAKKFTDILMQEIVYGKGYY